MLFNLLRILCIKTAILHEEAYFTIPVWESDRTYLRFQMDTRAPKMFTNIWKPFFKTFRYDVFHISVHIRFSSFGEDKSDCSRLCWLLLSSEIAEDLYAHSVHTCVLSSIGGNGCKLHMHHDPAILLLCNI